MKAPTSYLIVAAVFVVCAVAAAYSGEVGMSGALVLMALGIVTDSRIAARGADVGLTSDIRVLRGASDKGETTWLRLVRLAFHFSGIMLAASVLLLSITG